MEWSKLYAEYSDFLLLEDAEDQEEYEMLSFKLRHVDLRLIYPNLGKAEWVEENP